MPLYYMHLRKGADVLLDPDGMDIPSEAIADVALLQARDCMAGEMRDGVLDLRYRIDVCDDQGVLVHSVAFADAVKIVEPV